MRFLKDLAEFDAKMSVSSLWKTRGARKSTPKVLSSVGLGERCLKV